MKSVSFSIVTSLTLIYCPFPTNADQILRIRPENVFTNTTQLELVAALAETNLHRADTILKGLALEERGTNGATVLWWEANVGNFEAFDYLLGKRAKVGRLVTDTYSTLELCAKQEDPRFMEAAIRHGGNANSIGYFTRRTPIFAAISARTKRNAETLIKNGAYLDLADPTGITPVLWASESGAFDFVVLLLKHGANPNIQDNRGTDVRQVMREANPETGHPLYSFYTEAMKLLDNRRKK